MTPTSLCAWRGRRTTTFASWTIGVRSDRLRCGVTSLELVLQDVNSVTGEVFNRTTPARMLVTTLRIFLRLMASLTKSNTTAGRTPLWPFPWEYRPCHCNLDDRRVPTTGLSFIANWPILVVALVQVVGVRPPRCRWKLCTAVYVTRVLAFAVVNCRTRRALLTWLRWRSACSSGTRILIPYVWYGRRHGRGAHRAALVRLL